jgi:hypothetical protein
MVSDETTKPETADDEQQQPPEQPEQQQPLEQPEQQERRRVSKPKIDRLSLLNGYAAMRGGKPGLKAGTKLPPEVATKLFEEYQEWVEQRLALLMGETPEGFTAQEVNVLKMLAQKTIERSSQPASARQFTPIAPNAPQPMYQPQPIPQPIPIPPNAPLGPNGQPIQGRPQRRPTHQRAGRGAPQSTAAPLVPPQPMGPGPQPLAPGLDHDAHAQQNRKYLNMMSELERMEAQGPRY